MSDDDLGGGYEERLRRALHQAPTPDADADSVLARVHQGVRRRVRRRRMAASGGVAAVLAAGVIVVPTQLRNDANNVADPPPHPAKTKHPASATAPQAGSKAPSGGPGSRPDVAKKTNKPRAGDLTDPNGISVAAFATNDSGATRIIGKTSCADGPCFVTATGSTPSKAKRFRIAPSKDRMLTTMHGHTTATSQEKPAGVQVGTDPSNSWAWTDALYSTHDSGKTWSPVRLPGSLRVRNVESNDGRVWAFGKRPDGRPGVATSPEANDKWVAEPVPVRAGEEIKTPMVVGDEVAFVASDSASTRSNLVRRSSKGWQRRPVPCPQPVESSSARQTVWLGCRNAQGNDLVSWSHDRGKSWEVTAIRRPTISAVGGLNSDTAVVAAGTDLIRVDGDGTKQPASTPFDEGDDVWGGEPAYTAIRFTSNGTGYATTNGGALARSDDGGRTWQPEKLP